MDIETAIVLVTGANRGIGLEIVKALRDAGAKKIYAAIRDPSNASNLFDEPRILPIKLDITDNDEVFAAASGCRDVNLLINNAGINLQTGFIAAENFDNAQREMEVNYFGPFRMCRAFAPVLADQGGGMIVNVISTTAYVCIPEMGSLCASKAAAARLTQGVRAELAANGTHVMAVFPPAVKTDMTPNGKTLPNEVAAAILEAVRNEVEDLYPGNPAKEYLLEYKRDPKLLERKYADRLPK